MKSEPLIICEIKIIPKELVSPGIQNPQILSLLGGIDPEPYTPGTARFSCNQKQTSAGPVWTNELTWSRPGLLDAAEDLYYNSAGAVVAKAVSGENIVMHRNDIFQNSRLKVLLDAGTHKTQINYGNTTTECLM